MIVPLGKNCVRADLEAALAVDAPVWIKFQGGLRIGVEESCRILLPAEF